MYPHKVQTVLLKAVDVCVCVCFEDAAQERCGDICKGGQIGEEGER